MMSSLFFPRFLVTVAPANGVVAVAWLTLALVSGCAGGDAPIGATSEVKEQNAPDSNEPSSTRPPASAASSPRPWVGADGGAAPMGATTLVYETPDDFFCIGFACEPGTATDLGFNPMREGELWVVFRQTYNGEPCEGASGGDQSGCNSMRSKVAVISGATGEAPSVLVEEDGNSWHFMRLVTAIAFAEDDAFATVGEARTGNFTDAPADFMGPTLWSSDPAIFAQDFMLNGSHLDMLHATPFGMGIAHQRDHIFWAFNGQTGAVDRYDFRESHEPGGEDHTDGEMSRYATGELLRVANIPSHMAFAPDARTLLVADTGNGRVLALDTESGTRGSFIQTADPQIADPFEVVGASLRTVVPSGRLVHPSGLAVRGDAFVVCDAQTSTLFYFSLDGELLGQLETGLGPNSLTGLEFGPDQRLYAVHRRPGAVLRFNDWPPMP